MSAAGPVTVPAIRARKGGTPIVSLTAYDYPTAQAIDDLVDFILVGDSLGMVVHGLPTTQGVTLEMMAMHGKAVMRGAKRALVVVDMPFGSYEESPETAIRNAMWLMRESGCSAVKLEGGTEMERTIRFMTERGVPVLAHVGLMPQKVAMMGGFKTQGRNTELADKVTRDAEAVTAAGAFATVIEGTVEPLAREITEKIAIPTIGIGASPACDGQILVINDLLGLASDYMPKFVKRYAETSATIRAAVSAYGEDVRARRFPGPEHCFGAKKG
ncbi:MAG: 3-methyl-2-oxobutanoate hydroxymethyltransferase [Rhizobiales bacterium NRL2]|jgi:3-methyl-2-oxobutanoate hydroxymethyltransferase|nr:MAG: 3-methyl-2-oxobutanoate hydroxymethyltransferase [Rhizobiales bacterium NRL2]